MQDFEPRDVPIRTSANGHPKDVGRHRPASRSCRQDGDPHCRHRSERWNRAACRARTEHQLEQRDGIAKAGAERTQWAVPAVGDDQDPLADHGPQPPAAPAGKRAPPHISDRSHEPDRDQAMCRSPDQDCTPLRGAPAPHSITVPTRRSDDQAARCPARTTRAMASELGRPIIWPRDLA